MKLPPAHHRIVTAEEMAALDRATIQGAWGRTAVPSLKLMERAGQEAAKAIVSWWRARDGSSAGGAAAAKTKRAGAGSARGGAAAAMRRFTGGGPVVILCGHGNNGGDGFVAARHLKTAGFAVRVLVAAAERDLSADARANHQSCEKARIPVTFLPEPRAWAEGSEAEDAAGSASFLVDALLGTGSKGAPRGAIAAAIECALRSEKPTVSIDVPSGVDATTGHAEYPCVRAEMTVTLALPKAGLVFEPGRERAGRLAVVDIGIAREVVAGQRPSHLLTSAEWARPLLPTRAANAHKGTVGRVLFVGGSAGMMGAVALATESAYRAGAGYVVACVPHSCVDVLESRVAEVVKRGVAETGDRTLAAGAGDAVLAEAMRADVVVLGPGFSRHPESEALARALVELLDGPVVLDADGLNAFEGHPLRRSHGPLIITPHYGEAARLSGKSISDVARDPAAWARKFAADSGAIVCLKSVPMVTVAPGEPVLVNATGNPGMATAGAGDVLSGTIAGLLAQGMDPPEAAAVGCFVHGLAGDVAVRRKGRRGLMAGDIRDALPQRYWPWKAERSMTPNKPGGPPEPLGHPENDPDRRGIGGGTGKGAAASRRRAVRIAICHELIRAGKVLERRGMVVATEGNLSARFDLSAIVITRRGRRKGELTPRDFVEMALVEPEDSPARAAASQEHRVHLAAYGSRDDIEAVVHAHPVALTAFGLRGELPNFAAFDEARAFIGPIALVPYHPSGSEALAHAVGLALMGEGSARRTVVPGIPVLAPLGAPNLILLRNHGALTVGDTVDEALSRLEVAEHLATSLLLSERT